MHMEFIQSFNVIEKILKREVDRREHLTFYKLLDLAASKNKAVKKHKSELREFSDLRNLIVHGNLENPIALPSQYALERIKFISDQLQKPLKIKDKFQRHIKGVKSTDPLTDVLAFIKAHGYSQFPVVKDGDFIGLITENGIVNWLAKNIEEDLPSIKEIRIEDVMATDEECKNYGILYSQDSLYDVIDQFDSKEKTNRTYSVIVLNCAKKNIQLEDIYTIITPWDLDAIYSEIELTL